MKSKSFISKDPEIMGGMPVIHGTRIPIERVLYLITHDYNLSSIQQQYPWVKRSTLKGVIEEIIQTMKSSPNAPTA